ncbi:hypothetical protein KKG46_06100 [Patescibacteria group bacterium]|nr:hypothetical protein [Patescibacteria group bacterium]
MVNSTTVGLIKSLLERKQPFSPQLKKSLDDFCIVALHFHTQIATRAIGIPTFGERKAWLNSSDVKPHIDYLNNGLQVLSEAGINLKGLPLLDVCGAFLSAYQSQ